MNKKEKESTSKDSLIKVIAVTVLSLLGLSLLANTFFSNNPIPMGHGMMGRGHMGSGAGPGILGGAVSDIFIAIISLLMHLLWLFVLVALVTGLVILGKKALEQKQTQKQKGAEREISILGKCPHCDQNISEEYKFCPECRANLKGNCQDCGKELQRGWKCCPACGKTNGATDK